ncbi:hypothetical protein N9A82_00090 [Akkermansiaceae bacterium]|nr:hypothetical protein [Akkermansiaceae bacterium]
MKITGDVKGYWEYYFEKSMSGARRKDALVEELDEIAKYIAPTMEWLGYKFYKPIWIKNY